MHRLPLSSTSSRIASSSKVIGRQLSTHYYYLLPTLPDPVLTTLSLHMAPDTTSQQHLQRLDTSIDNNNTLNASDLVPTDPIDSSPLVDVDKFSTSTPNSKALVERTKETPPESTTTTPSSTNRNAFASLATFARSKTSGVIASLSDPSLRSRQSSSSLHNRKPTVSVAASPPSLPEVSQGPRSDTASDQPHLSVSSDTSASQSHLLAKDRPGLGHSGVESDNLSPAKDITADTTTPSPTSKPVDQYNKMHQTSSRLLRMTDDERPFTRVCHDCLVYVICLTTAW